jgi:paraquat-inducible protein B
MTQIDSDQAIPQALAKRPSRLSMVWLLPLIAAAIGGWLAYKAITEADISINIHFESGEGISAGKTEIRYQGIVLGKVDRLSLNTDLAGVIAHASVDRRAREALKHNTRFWLVKPEVSFGGVSGLDTLLSGNYITLQPGDGASKRDFHALSEPPTLNQRGSGLSLTLTADNLGSLHVGSPVQHRGITVGEVLSYRLGDDGRQVSIGIHIEQEHTHRVRSNSRFWNNSGINISGALPHFKLRTGSLASMIAGGISFDTPAVGPSGETVANRHHFQLFEDYQAAQSGISVIVHLDSADGITEGHTPVKFKGMTLATVRSLKPNDDFSGVEAEVLFDPRADFALNTSTRFWLVEPQISLSEISGLGTLLGGSYLEMDFGEGDSQREFVVLAKPPTPTPNGAGLRLTLKADKLSGLNRGSEIYYKQVAIGRVEGFRLSDARDVVLVDVLIEPEYQDLILSNTLFYQAGGVQVSGGLDGLELKTESLTALIKGGIGIHNPAKRNSDSAAPIIRDGHQFVLYENRDKAINRGPRISVSFIDGEGLKVGTKVKYKGIDVGKVDALHLNTKGDRVVASIALLPSARHLARETSQFWITRAQLGLSNSAHLGTLISGVHISVKPGSGRSRTRFVALPQPPVTADTTLGLRLVLQTPKLGSLKVGVPVYFRDIPVGKVDGYRLGNTAQFVDIEISIEERYAALVSAESQFWNASGIGVDFGLFSGAKIRANSVESILSGGIAFATPEAGTPVPPGTRFVLHEEPNEVWLDWSPRIELMVNPTSPSPAF